MLSDCLSKSPISVNNTSHERMDVLRRSGYSVRGGARLFQLTTQEALKKKVQLPCYKKYLDLLKA